MSLERQKMYPQPYYISGTSIEEIWAYCKRLYVALTEEASERLQDFDHGKLIGLGDDDHTSYILAAGTRALTADWDAGGYEIRSLTFESDVATGTAPLTIASTTAVTNLNADLLDGYHASSFLTGVTAHQLDSATYHTVSGLTPGHFLKATGATTFGFAAHGLTYSDVGAEVSGATSTHAALTTGVHGLAITAGQTLTVTTGGTLGSAAYTAATAYDVSGAATSAVSGHESTYTHANIAHGETAYGWGDHSDLHSPSYLTATAETALSGEVNLGALATGLLKGTVAAGVSTISAITDSSANWDSAYGWGNHASAGYLTSVTAHELTSATHTTSSTSATYLRGDKSWATLNQAAVDGLTTGASPAFVTVKLSGLTDGYVPYHVSDAAGLANGPIFVTGASGSVLIGATAAVGEEKLYALSSGTTDNAAAIYAKANGAGGTNHYGIWVNVDGATNNYGVYSQATLNYFTGNVSALSFTDRTPHYEGDALLELSAIKGRNGKIDHSTLPKFAQAKNGERDLGAMISMLVVANQQLYDRVVALEKGK